jgi:hypothetical protein
MTIMGFPRTMMRFGMFPIRAGMRRSYRSGPRKDMRYFNLAGCQTLFRWQEQNKLVSSDEKSWLMLMYQESGCRRAGEWYIDEANNVA